MTESVWRGLLVVVAAGVAQGSFMLPMKRARWEWENTWLIFASTAYLIFPWLLLLWMIPEVFSVYRAVPAHVLAITFLFGIGAGIGALTFGLGVAAVGLALGVAVILGVAACTGTLIPLLLLPTADLSASRWALTAASLGLMLAGVAVCSFAGAWKEKVSGRTSALSYRKGLLVCVTSGILSSCYNLGFVYGDGIIERAQAMGVPPDAAPNTVWAVLVPAVFTCNAGYSVYLLRRRGTARNFTRSGTASSYLAAALMGALWISGLVFYGIGARQMGALGSSLGWSILTSTTVAVSNLLGIATGEWRGAPPPAVRRLAAGLLLLLLAIAGLGYATGMDEIKRATLEFKKPVPGWEAARRCG